jgi:hypothetical protein
MYYGHGSWIVVVVFGGMFALRALSSQRRRGRYGRTPPSSSSFTSTDRRGPGGGPVAGSENLEVTTHAGTAPGWYRDPFFKHDQRYFSGTEWTEHVTDNDAPGVDPPPERPLPDAGD